MPEPAFLLEGPPGIPPSPNGSVITVGTFDGVHRGHQAVLREIGRRAREAGRRSVLVTFDPHPLRIVRPEFAPPLLSTPLEKKEILAQSGIDWVVFLRFTPAMSRLSPEAFVRDILLARLDLRELVVGYDHGFGRDRAGDGNTLLELGRSLGFDVDVVGPVEVDGGAISSSRIRGWVGEGRFPEARAALGRAYGFRGIVTHGDARGRTLGFPTANLLPEHSDKLLPPEGVYAVRVRSAGGVDLGGEPTRIGALHVGPRPTFAGSPSSVELHILDFSGDLYGHSLRVEVLERIRGVSRFPDPEALKAQLAKDVARSRLLVSSDGEP